MAGVETAGASLPECSVKISSVVSRKAPVVHRKERVDCVYGN